jgi:hypothetical protein
MNSKMLPIAAVLSSFLVGCGGSGSDSGSGGNEGNGGNPTPPPVVTYHNIQFVHLVWDYESDMQSSCATYGVNTNAAVIPDDPALVYAIVADYDFNILVHNSDGTVKQSINTSALSNGLLKLDESTVPDGGYLSVEEIYGGSQSTDESHMLSIAKGMLQDMTINVRKTQPNGNACISGERASVSEYNQYAKVGVAKNNSESGIHLSNAGKNDQQHEFINNFFDVTAEVPSDNDILVTSYSSYDTLNNELHGLTGYVFVDKLDVYDSSTDSGNVNTLEYSPIAASISIPVELTLDDESSVNVLYDDKIYTWQPIYNTSTSYGIDQSNSGITKWSLDLSGEVSDNWQYETTSLVSELGINIVVPAHSSFAATGVDDNCANGAKSCLNAMGYSNGDSNIQRTYVRALTSSNNPQSYTRVVYAPTNSSQPLMESHFNIDIDVSAIEIIEVGLLNIGDITDSQTLNFMERHTSFVNASDRFDPTLVEHLDFTGVISLPSDQSTSYIAIMDDQRTILKNRLVN